MLEGGEKFSLVGILDLAGGGLEKAFSLGVFQQSLAYISSISFHSPTTVSGHVIRTQWSAIHSRCSITAYRQQTHECQDIIQEPFRTSGFQCLPKDAVEGGSVVMQRV